MSRCVFSGGGKLDGQEFQLPDDPPPPFYFVARRPRLGSLLAATEADALSAPIIPIAARFRRGGLDDLGRYVYREEFEQSVESQR